MPLLSELDYGALLAYSPRGRTEPSRRSRDVCYKLKAGDPGILQLSALRLSEHIQAGGTLAGFFRGDVTLVPMPRSAPLVAGALWPSHKICELIVQAKFAARTVPVLERVTAVPKSAHAQPGGRPSVSAHYDSMRVNRQIDVGARILIVDDVVTKGNTAIAAASRVSEMYPQAEIKLFAVIRTKGMIPDIEQILEPVIGTIQLLNDEGLRNP